MLVALISVFIIGWVAVAVIGTQAYFLGEQTKPIHDRNWRSEGFEKLAKAFTGKETDFANRTPGFPVDAYSSQFLPNE